VPDLVAKVTEQRAVRFVHRDPRLLAVYVVALGEIQCDDSVVVSGDDFLRFAGQQVECQAVGGVLVARHNRQLQADEFDDQSPLGLLDGGERG
jgi:hypothetical protein